MRAHVHSSALWRIQRPKTPLTPGHLLLRLNDPATAFDAASAADLLHCYRLARAALGAVAGATGAALYLPVDWHPVGEGLGEPAAETSTPTIHLFAEWPSAGTAGTGSAATTASALAVPLHRRSAATATGLASAGLDTLPGLDAALRAQMRAADRPTPSRVTAAETPGTAPAHHRPIVLAVPEDAVSQAHWTAGLGVPSLAEADPPLLLAIGEALAGAMVYPPGRPAVAGPATAPAEPPFRPTGFSCWAVESWQPGAGPLELAVFGRSHRETVHPLAIFLTRGSLGPIPAG
ncbi:hypothetical protein [Arthrobacter sp. 35W]|uniref:hypothetical protein n=1 Tax=Arthrobacter sp. 35W TaxID=1132441 RepID=UPI0003FE994A|nr:hypothetical protein [Arthrobacter sp. 35W]